MRKRVYLDHAATRVFVPAAMFLGTALLAACQGTNVVPDFPIDIYPSPVPVNEGIGISPLSTACPNPEGLESAAQLDIDTALDLLYTLSGDVSAQRRVTDPAYWPLLDGGDGSGRLARDQVQIDVAEASPYADLLANACGEQMVAATRWVEVCPATCAQSERTSPALISHFYLIRREGHWLVWAVT